MLMSEIAVFEAISDELGPINEPDSPLMAGVTHLYADQAFRSPAAGVKVDFLHILVLAMSLIFFLRAVLNNGVIVSSWSGQPRRPLIVRGTRNGRNLVEINLLPPSSQAHYTYWVRTFSLSCSCHTSSLLSSLNSHPPYSTCLKEWLHGGRLEMEQESLPMP